MRVRRCQPQSRWILADFRARLHLTHFGLVARQRERNAVARAPSWHEMPHFQVIGYDAEPVCPTLHAKVNRDRKIVCARPALRVWNHEVTIQTSEKYDIIGGFMPQAEKAVLSCSPG